MAGSVRAAGGIGPEAKRVPAPAELLVARPVTTAVNSTRNDGHELIAEATGDQLVV
jgi:hypothetical protein